jgi:hypothetical protein
MLGAAIGGKRSLKRGHFRAVDELAMREYAPHRFVHR